jgi:hypothetical protein
LLSRDTRTLTLGTTPYRAPNVAFVLRSPARVGPFKRGADRFFRISGRERRLGLDVDVVAVEVDDPEALMAAARRRGVPVSASVGASLASVVGEATGQQVQERLGAIARQRLRQRVSVALVALAVAGAISLRLSLVPPSEADPGLIARMLVAALAGAIIAGVIGSSILSERRRPHRSSGVLSRVLMGLGPIVAVGTLVVLFLNADTWVGAPFVLAHAAVGALVGGGLLAPVLREAPHPIPPPGPLILDGRPRERGKLLVALISVSVLALVAAGEAGSTRDLSIARSAVVSVQDLPSGWVTCCGASTYRGSALEGHICGSGADLPAHTAGFDREFSFELTDDGLESGHLVQAVFLAPTEAAARREYAAIDSSGYSECAMASVARSARISVIDPVDVVDSTFVRSELPGGVPGVVDRFTTVFRTRTGTDVVYTAFVRMRVERAIVRMPIMTYTAPLADAELRPIVDVVANKVGAAIDHGA